MGDKKSGSRRLIGSHQGILNQSALIRRAASYIASIRALPDFQANRLAGALLARPQNRPRFPHPARPRGDLPRTPTAARPDRPYELPPVAARRRTMRHHTPNCRAWTLGLGPYDQGRKSWALPSNWASDPAIISQFGSPRDGRSHDVPGTSVPSAAGVQLPLLGTSGT